MTKLNYLDFDLQLSDYAKVVVLVGNLLEPRRLCQCDVFDPDECHHLAEHNHRSQHDKLKLNCHFCKFLKFLKANHSNVKVDDEESQSEKYLPVRYKTSAYPSDVLDWCEFQPWRAPYLFIGHAICLDKNDLSLALKNFELIKEKFRKTIITSKLIIDLRFPFESSLILKRENSENFESKKTVSLERQISLKNFDDLSVNFEDSLKINECTTLNSELNQNSSMLAFSETNSRVSTISLNSTIVIETQFDENELSKKLKSLESDLIYLDNVNKECLINESENDKFKIQKLLENSISVIYKKLSYLIKIINPSDEKQINNYSEFLKAPLERGFGGIKAGEATLSDSSFLSIKVVNKKTVSARMHKYKADLLLSLNCFDQALFHFVQASTQSKKEQDNLWYYSAMEGLCVASYFLLREAKSLLTKNELENERKSSIIDLKNSIKRRFSSKDLNQLAIPLNEFSKHYQSIVTFYHRNELSKFLTVEVSLMMAKFFLQNNMRTDAMWFINQAIYVNNLQVVEEVRIRRYYEIGKLYDWCELKRLSLLYKWISATRWSRLIDANNRSIPSAHRDCLIKRCAEIFIENFAILKIVPQSAPKAQPPNDSFRTRGFPASKMHILNQLIHIFKFTNNPVAKNRIAKYLINEMSRHLNEQELKIFVESLIEPINDDHEENDNKSQFSKLLNDYDTKFFKIPKINSFAVIAQSLGANVIGKIKIVENQQTNGIYIHRYENPLYCLKPKKVYNIRANTVNKIQMSLANPIPIDLNIDSIDLVVRSEESDEFLVELFDLKNSTNQTLIIPANESNFIVEMGFKIEKLGRFQIIGYEINQFNNCNKILFTELLSTKTTKLNNNNDSLIDSSYDLEITPKLPLIKEIELILEEPNSNSNSGCKIVECKKPVLSSKLGLCQFFKLKLEQENDDFKTDLTLIESKCVVLNEQLARMLNADICLEKDQNNNNNSQLYLKIDTSNFSSDFDGNKEVDNLELQCLIELKYTNKIGSERNVCYSLRKQFFLSFEKVFNANIKEIKDLNENEVKIVVIIKNLTRSKLYTDLDKTNEILPESDFELNSRMEKFDLKKMLESKTDTSNIRFMSKLISERLDLKLASSKNNFHHEKLNFHLNLTNQVDVLRYKNVLFKSPIKFASFLCTNQTNSQLNCLTLIANKSLSDEELKNEEYNFDGYKFDVCLKNRLRHKLVNIDYNWELRDFKTNKFWIKEYKFLGNTEAKIEFSLILRKLTNSTSCENLLEWNYEYDFSAQKLNYTFI